MHADRPTRFREVFASGEFRALYAASALSWIGDYAARAAVTAMVYDHTGSVAASGAAFAISFAPWLLGGSVLVALAERYPYRRVMLACDLARMVVMAALAVLAAGLGLPVLLALLLLCALFSPPFDAARSATMPQVLGPERYVAGISLTTGTGPPVQVLGYVLGATVATHDPRLALAFNAATFGVSALLVRFGTQLRESALRPERRTGLLRETGDGFGIVFRNPALRALVLLVFAASLFAIVPEGHGAAWAGYREDGLGRGWAQGLLMAAVPAGMLIGALVAGRLLRPSWRRAVLRPLALATPLALIPTVLDPPVVVVAGLALVAGFAIGALVPLANGEFVQAVPSAYRARAFGVVSAGLQLLQGFAVLATGALAQRNELPMVVGLWSSAGLLLLVGLIVMWPPAAAFAEARARAAAMDGAEVVRAAPTARSAHPNEPAVRSQRHDEPTVRSELPERLDPAERLESSARPAP